MGKAESKTPLPKHSIVCDEPNKAEEADQDQDHMKREEVQKKWDSLHTKALLTAIPSTKTHHTQGTQEDEQATTTFPTQTAVSRTLKLSLSRNSSSQSSKCLFTTKTKTTKEEDKSTINKTNLLH